VSELLPSDDTNVNPVVFATFRGNAKVKDRKRILFYGHYDVVQAENDRQGWKSDPFTMAGIDEYLYGRGTSDNKGPLLAAIYAVADLIADKTLDGDVVFLIEGEEECGSRGFDGIIRKHKQKIGNVDWVLLANSYWLDDEVPCLTYGLRGVIHATVEITSDNPDLHSGVDGSSRGDESMKDLLVVLNSLVGLHGKVKLPGFYDNVLPLTDDEADHYERITSTLLRRNPKLGDQDKLSKQLQQKWREASLTVHSIETSGPSNATIIPKLAKASISLRLVPQQESGAVANDLVAYLDQQFAALGSSNRLSVTIDHTADPWLGDIKNEIYRTLEEGIIHAWPEKFGQPPAGGGAGTKMTTKKASGRPGLLNRTSSSSSFLSASSSASSATIDRPLYIREGGSIPAIRFLEKEFGAPAAHFPCGQASDHAHLYNERLRLVNLYKSREVFKWVFRKLPRKET
jgi:di- and tripeptidase